MEKFQGPTNQCFFGENLDVDGGLEQEQGQGGFVFSYGGPFLNTSESFRFQEEDQQQQHLQHQHQQQQQEGEEEPLQQSLSLSIPIGLEDKMPFLEMLQSVESPPYSPFAEPPPHIRVLLTTLQKQQQQRKQCGLEGKYLSSSESAMDYSFRMQGSSAQELESCITTTTTTQNDMASESHSPVKLETNEEQEMEQEEQTCPPNYSFSSHPVEGVSSSACCNGELPSSSPEEETCGKGVSSPTTCCWVENGGSRPKMSTTLAKLAPSAGVVTSNTSHGREKKKRKRTRPSKNREEVESQRMTHIAVERNRRRQMNDHLNALRSLMPPSFVQRGDQASIIGGAIDFVKELEQLLQSLEAKKRMRILSSSSASVEEGKETCKKRSNKSNSGDNSLIPFHGFFSSPQYTSYSSALYLKEHLENINEDSNEENNNNNYNYNSSSRTRGEEEEGEEEEEEEEKEEVVMRMNKLQRMQQEEVMKCMVAADIEVIVVQTHVNLKILSPRRPGQLVRAIAALEDLRLTILHLNVTSFQLSVLYSFNLKIEDDCRIGSSADEIATAVHQIFSYINNCGGGGN